MTVTQMRDWFGVLQANYDVDYFSDAEVEEFLQDAMMDIINETIILLEENEDSVMRIRTLVTAATAATDANGLLALPDSTSIALLSLSLSSGKRLQRYTNREISRIEDNAYKAGTAANPNYTIVDGGYQTYPALNAVSLDYVYIKQPTSVDDLPENMHKKQVSMAMVKTGLVTENQATTMIGAAAKG